MKVDQELKQKWIDALRSGEYEQGSSALVYKGLDDEERFCCLGVLCELSSEAKRYPDGKGFIVARHKRDAYVQINGKMKLSKRLAELNDGGTSFDRIADVIEKELEV